ncbi:Methionine synthase [Sporomusa ovata DSM 2662]|uniref:Dimethylamine corrinoid protein 2 n=1 Tax=Sporomusa ovata TaxID=2378 RepID=A0A0U1L512_9FIRM|nr:corrinoid protein [Sporomusa ovata]EQB28468.1 dimethylamine corrinoid protein 2 [Sporomusa ovata DSM 2662]CQR74787.1 Dimethylamine corrinoid protein 2 [Sporomusa ovata]
MPVNKEELFKKLSDAVVDMSENETVSLAEKIIAKQVDAYEAVEKGLSDGMDRAGTLFEEEEYFIPELLLCSDAMYAGLEVLKGHIKVAEQGEKRKVVIGVVEGDTHDIGKNLVKIMLEASGFDVYDLGRDILPAAFVEKAKEVNADIIALATLMTTTMEGMAAVVQILQEQNIKDSYKVIIGGGPISQSFADKIGADGYAVNAADAVRLSRRLLG